ncbi:MAG: methyltransferase domain-containing protein [Alphaproteobacteria bacterium]|nr:methyltransferase domain-containing protein [Alphaproteobacteria bacterium]
MADDARVSGHYTQDDLLQKVLAALQEAGKDTEALTVDDLAPVDHFHGRGLEATLELFGKLELADGHHVLDIGSGIGGPARWMAAKHGCRVTGIDLTEAFCAVAQALTAQLGMEDRVSIHIANALDLPFEADSFDAAYSQNVAMNIPDKAGYFAEAFRVMKPGALFGTTLIVRGDGGDPFFPVPWATEPSVSFLTSEQDIVDGLEQAGFDLVSLSDESETSLAHSERMRERAQREGPPVLGPHVLMGEEGRTKLRNSVRSVAEGRVRPLEIVCRKPG